MSEHPNAALVRRMSDLVASGDLQGAAAFLADDVVWHEIGRKEPRRGVAELAASMGQVDYTISGSVHDVVANDQHTVALFDAVATRGARTFSYRVAEVYHIRDGKITERWAFSDDTQAIADFFA
jgi:ketosteroid isomerase-like protein